MRMTHVTTALVATIMTAGLAMPAQADVGRTMAKMNADRQVQIVRAACKNSFSAAGCGSSQRALIKSIAADVSTNRAVSEQEIGNRQLDVLIGSVN